MNLKFKVSTLIFILILFPFVLLAQTASFYADTTHFFEETKNRIDIYNKIMEAEWRINGQTLHYGSAPIKVKTDNLIDTIFYKQLLNSKWDTLICNINKAKNYTFYFNACCGGFNIADENNKQLIGSVNYILKNADNNKNYIGTIGESGMIVNAFSDNFLNPGCRSAMSSNVYTLKFSEISICSLQHDCNEEICLYEKGKAELNYEFNFKTISNKLTCLYLPLSNQPIKVIYNAKSGIINIE